jgi:pyruvate,water dikinase
MKTVLKGIPVFPGKVKGKVLIIKKYEDALKVKKDSIIVSVKIQPDFVIAVSKAKAIITDTGGQTSHAAIIARELRIPCIIGTQNATKILKNSDLIEVNALNGTIKKLGKHKDLKEKRD